MKKLYYSIGEVSELSGVEPHILRYWESVFDQLSPAKNRAGKRVYTDKDIETVLELKKLIKEEKYSTAGARKVLRRQQKGGKKPEEQSEQPLPAPLLNDLGKIRVFLNDLLNKL